MLFTLLLLLLAISKLPTTPRFQVLEFATVENNPITNDDIIRHIPLLPYPKSPSELAASRLLLIDGYRNLTKSLGDTVKWDSRSARPPAPLRTSRTPTPPLASSPLVVGFAARLEPLAQSSMLGEGLLLGQCSSPSILWEFKCGYLGNSVI
jgi:hypothetical protein